MWKVEDGGSPDPHACGVRSSHMTSGLLQPGAGIRPEDMLRVHAVHSFIHPTDIFCVPMICEAL